MMKINPMSGNEMNERLRPLTIGLVLGLIVAGCTPSQPPAELESAQRTQEMPVASPSVAEPPLASPAAPTSTTASGSMVVYTCEDGGSLTVTYDKHSALVKLPTGSTMLSRTESTPGGISDAFLGEELSLYRSGNLVRVEVAGKTRACTETPPSG
jgi:hypothetical protein